jgi:hypothetical protein
MFIKKILILFIDLSTKYLHFRAMISSDEVLFFIGMTGLNFKKTHSLNGIISNPLILYFSKQKIYGDLS